MPSAACLGEQPAAGRPSPAGGGAGGHGTAAARCRGLRADRARQLADLLRGQVLGGAYAGGVLPHESDLGADYGATRNTARQALDLLRSERLVERVPGVGTVVVAEKYAHGLDRLQGLAGTLHEHGRVTPTRSAPRAPSPPPPASPSASARPRAAGCCTWSGCGRSPWT